MGRGASPRGALTAASHRPDPGLYGPDSETWRLDREAMLLLSAGPRALLLQVAHPAIAAGVAAHSDFRADPWRRLAATLRSYLTIVYGATSVARAEIRRLHALHGSVVGPGYSGRDPELSLWVHATLVDATIVTYDAWIAPLDGSRRVRAYEESRPIGRAFGIPERLLPVDLDAFEGYVASMLGAGGPVHPGRLARELAGPILRPPLGPLTRQVPVLAPCGPLLSTVPPSTYGWILWPAVGLLPPSIREGYGIAWGPWQRAVAAWLVAGWRAWRPLIPEGWRQMPQALAADRRMAGASGRQAARPAGRSCPRQRGR